ncbi:MAG TPA: class I SAM-dependent methyltransferase [bacterium]|nr:class I SAM-dependent methyltransferase [bacterium]
MNLKNYRTSENETKRLESILSLIPENCKTALDVGARDGFHVSNMADRFEEITALDLTTPEISIKNVECVAGDIRKLQFSDNSFDMVFCAEVLEHIPEEFLGVACSELARVSKKYLMIGVPYKQDTRVGRLVCQNCKKINPPWGHVNEFDEKKLLSLFQGLIVEKIELVGKGGRKTNFLTVFLRSIAGYPYGTYHQDEPCIYCNSKMICPSHISFVQKTLCFVAEILEKTQNRIIRKDPHWIHILFSKNS